MGVLDHPFFAVTDDDGTFTIPNLPPGKYTLEAWHEELGPRPGHHGRRRRAGDGQLRLQAGQVIRFPVP